MVEVFDPTIRDGALMIALVGQLGAGLKSLDVHTPLLGEISHAIAKLVTGLRCFKFTLRRSSTDSFPVVDRCTIQKARGRGLEVLHITGFKGEEGMVRAVAASCRNLRELKLEGPMLYGQLVPI